MLFGLLLVVSLRLISPTTANLSYVALALLALFSIRMAIIALALSWLFTMINPGLAPEASFATAGRFLVVFAAACSVFVRSSVFKKPRFDRMVIYVTLFGLFVVLHSLFFSTITTVSLLRILIWTVAFLTLFSAWSSLDELGRKQLGHFIYFGLVLLAVLSVPLIFSALGYLRNERGLQGVLNHPQAFGSAMGLLAAWAAARILHSQRLAVMDGLVFILAVILVLLSEARTGGLAMILGITSAMLSIRVFQSQPLHRLFPILRNRIVPLLVILILTGLVVFAPQINSITDKFITKSGRADVADVVAAFERSRGVLYEPMLENIRAQPWIGIGWGIGSDPWAMRIETDPIFGLPIGAPIEKGVMPVAVLEELGVVGLLIFVLLILFFLRTASKGGIVPLALLLTVLFINLGEATLFSPGGMGMLQLLLLTYALGLGSTAKKHRKLNMHTAG